MESPDRSFREKISDLRKSITIEPAAFLVIVGWSLIGEMKTKLFLQGCFCIILLYLIL